MSQEGLQIQWPLGEAIGTACEMGEPILAPQTFLASWGGLDTPGYLDLMIEKSRNLCSIVQAGEATGCLFGDLPGSFFLGSAREVRACDEISGTALALFKWIAAPEDYGLPTECQITRESFGRKLLSKTWATEGRDYYFFCSNESGEEVLARDDVPIITFRSGICTIDVYELKLPASHQQEAEFELYLLSGTFVNCRCIPRMPDDGDQAV